MARLCSGNYRRFHDDMEILMKAWLIEDGSDGLSPSM